MRRAALAMIVAALAAWVCACGGGSSTAGGAGGGGSGGSSAAAAGAIGAGCATDRDCGSGFCDRDRCAAPAAEHAYGRDCVAGPAPAADPGAGKLYVCGAYLCREARCRSCASDEECRAELGAPRCAQLADRPGRRCGAE